MRRNFRGVRLKNVQRIKKGGRVYKYHRRTRAPLPGDIPEDHPDFLEAWAREERGGTKPVVSAHGTLGAACEALLASARYLGLSPDYRRAVRSHVEAIRAGYGAAPLARLEAHHIEVDLAKLPPHPANARLKAWRLVCGNAKDIGLTRSNASIGIGKKATPKSDGHPDWTPDEIATFRAHWPIGSTQRRAFELVCWTGARTIDAVKLSPSMVGRDGLLVYRQNKTANPAHIPWTCPLPAWAPWDDERREAMAALSGNGFTFLETLDGKVRSHKGLSNLIRDAAKAAGIPKSAHGLRKSRLIRIAEAGGSAHAIMAWGGHVTLSEAQDYCRRADLRRVVMGESVNHADPVYKIADK